MFDRRIQANTPGRFTTAAAASGRGQLPQGLLQEKLLKQYNKGGRVLRTEVCVNDPRDFRIGRSLVPLEYLGTVAYHAIGRFLKAQAVVLATALDRPTFERLVTPSVEGRRAFRAELTRAHAERTAPAVVELHRLGTRSSIHGSEWHERDWHVRVCHQNARQRRSGPTGELSFKAMIFLKSA